MCFYGVDVHQTQFQDPIYALLIASLLGLSTAHIFFGSVVETYIFSAAALIGFVLILQKRTEFHVCACGDERCHFWDYASRTLSKTLSAFLFLFLNISQVKRQRPLGSLLNKIFRFTALTLSFGIVISLIHAAWYPSSKLFFLLSDAQAEEEFAFSIFQEPTWRAVGRAMLLVRTILLYTVIAPQSLCVWQ